MLSPAQEIDPVYLRTLRQTLSDVLLPEVGSSAARNALRLADDVLVRMIAALEDGAHGCLPESALAWRVRSLFEELDRAADSERSQILRRLVDIADVCGASCDAREASVRRVSTRSEPKLRALTVTPAALQAYLSQRFSAADPRLAGSHQIPGGRSKLTVLLSIEPNPILPSDIVLRFDNPGSAQDTAVADEFPAMRLLYESGVSTPEPLWLEPDPGALGAPFLAMRRMAGAAPGSFWSAEGVSPALGRELARKLAKLHRIDATIVWPSSRAAARDTVSAMVSKLEARWQAAGAVRSPTMACAFAWLKRHIDWIDGGAAPLHGDVHFANVLAEGDRLICLIDWEFVHPGHPAEDLAFCRPYIEQIMPWPDFIAAYLAAGGLPVTEQQLRFFAIWGLLRGVTFGACVLGGITDRAIPDVQNLAIALHSRAKIEARLAAALAVEMRADSPIG